MACSEETDAYIQEISDLCNTEHKSSVKVDIGISRIVYFYWK